MILIIGGTAQGKTQYARKLAKEGWHIEDDFHLKVKAALQKNSDPLEEAKNLLTQYDPHKLIIVSNEMGYGIVPIDPFERKYREKNGRVNCYLAEHAEQVIRVICGLGEKIK
ncbi:MAG: bifunctional adenosylcobinamide kinase/adenosylcobinamide-phosphate guanylyltransferase [Lachnospiraceae bacterium]|nr:bifunctional adenosylcobinamide kinase/adenosylcobinamide-phosphate guanylyltransferase [Lachnospiraceae bacterium]